MRRRVNKIIEATPMSRQEAERILQQPIDNLLHGDMGYMVNGKWIPAGIIERDTVPFETDADIVHYASNEMKDLIRWFQSKNRSHARTLFRQSKRLYEFLKN